jgi:hypothetical protein
LDAGIYRGSLISLHFSVICGLLCNNCGGRKLQLSLPYISFCQLYISCKLNVVSKYKTWYFLCQEETKMHCRGLRNSSCNYQPTKCLPYSHNYHWTHLICISQLKQQQHTYLPSHSVDIFFFSNMLSK